MPRLPIRTRKPFRAYLLVFIAPALVVYSVFFVLPLVDSMRLSFFRPSELGGPLAWVGLRNYIDLVTTDPWATRFWGALRHNAVFFVIIMLVQNPIGMTLAALLDARLLRGRAVYRTVLFAPAMLSVVVSGFVWKLMLSPIWGVVHEIMQGIGIGSLFRPWLGLEKTALVTLSLISSWQYFGIPMMLFLAALVGVPDELIDSARVDGASAWGCFWRIQFPLIMPTVGIVTVLTFTGTLNAFDLVFSVQSLFANPNYATDLLGTFFYRTFFGAVATSANPTMGATVGMAIFLIIMAGVLLYLFTWQRRMLTFEV